MAQSAKEIKRRIRSVVNIGQITKAMELVAAVKMQKAQEATLKSREYSKRAWDLVERLSKKEKGLLPLLDKRPIKKVAVLVIASDRGLCGSFNANILNIAKKTIKELQEKYEVDLIGVGKKIQRFASKSGFNLSAEFSGLDKAEISDVYPISEILIKGFVEKKYDQVILIYTDFVSTLKQSPKRMTLLPLDKEDLDLGDAYEGNLEKEKIEVQKEVEYEFEPDKVMLLEKMLPRLIEVQIYQALLESFASEHSARMVAMKSASESSDELVRELNLNYNRARQAGITAEIAEISAGAQALE